MSAPLPPVADQNTDATPVALAVMRRRTDFLKTADARRQSTPGFFLQARKRPIHEPGDGMRIGFTCSKKVGNAVARNRAKRRLREIARRVLPGSGRAGWDYVLVGRATATAQRPFAELCMDLQNALTRIHQFTS